MAVLKYYLYLAILAAGCTMPDEKKFQATMTMDSSSLSASDSNTAVGEEAPALPEAARLRSPKGFYHASLPISGGIDQTIAFYSDYTYRLQESYRSAKDSVVVTKGSWTPSDGFIWLYKDQVVRGRYSWKNDQLQYYSPLLKKSFPMQPLQDILTNSSWKGKAAAGTAVFGIGNEPFWSVEVMGQDSLIFQLADRGNPLHLKIKTTERSADSTVYHASNDSVSIRLSVYPYFCNDGMSDQVYTHQVRLQFGHQSYKGCGVIYK